MSNSKVEATFHGATEDTFLDRLRRIANEIELADYYTVHIGRDGEGGRYFYQIRLWRRDVITGEMGYGHGGKYYLSPHASDSELIQTIWGAYQAYWLHEARETFMWRGRRIFGPHISAEALHSVANKVDLRSARHVEDRT